MAWQKGKKREPKVESKKPVYHLEEGEKVKLAKGDSPHYDKTEAAPGIMVGKSPKYV